jgi:hypothetical protein
VGNWSVTLTFVAAALPLFVTRIVKTIVPLMLAEVGLTLFVTTRFAAPVVETVLISLKELSAGLPSRPDAPAWTVLLMTAPLETEAETVPRN